MQCSAYHIYCIEKTGFFIKNEIIYRKVYIQFQTKLHLHFEVFMTEIGNKNKHTNKQKQQQKLTLIIHWLVISFG